MLIEKQSFLATVKGKHGVFVDKKKYQRPLLVAHTVESILIVHKEYMTTQRIVPCNIFKKL